MKKNLLFLMVLSMCLLFTACSKDDEGSEGTGSKTETSVNTDTGDGTDTDDGTETDAGVSITDIVINENGKASNGSMFSAVDDKNYYLDYIKYSVEEGHLAVSGYDKTGFNGEAKIVSSITYKGNHYEVLSINNNVFKNCEKLTSLTIPSSVTSIGSSAFEGCVGLTSVDIPNSVTAIATSAFYGCSGLTSLTIGNSVTSIGERAFHGCSGLTSLTIGNSVTTIGTSAFSGCSGLTSVTIPNSVTSIGSSAFSGCSGLTSVTIGNSVTSIGEAAFKGCTGLTSIVVDKNNSVYDSRENCNAIIETATNSMILECSTTVVPEGVTSSSKMVLSGQWQGDWGMYYGYTYPNGDYVEYDSYNTDIIFYPDFEYGTHGYGYQVDWYRTGPYQRLSYRFSWTVSNGIIFLTYPGYPEYNMSIRNYRLDNRHFTGYFTNSTSPFDLLKIQDYYNWSEYENLYINYGYVFLEWDWNGVYYYYAPSYAKTRGVEATDTVGKAIKGKVTKIGNRIRKYM